jgi:hypothetical protein
LLFFNINREFEMKMKKLFLPLLVFSLALMSQAFSATFDSGVEKSHAPVSHSSAAFASVENALQVEFQVIQRSKTEASPQAKSVAGIGAEFSHGPAGSAVSAPDDNNGLAQMPVDRGIGRRYQWRYQGWC